MTDDTLPNTIVLRKNDTSDSTKGIWKGGTNEDLYHRHEDPCDGAPTSGYLHYEAGEVHNLDPEDLCPDCDWSGTGLTVIA